MPLEPLVPDEPLEPEVPLEPLEPLVPELPEVPDAVTFEKHIVAPVPVAKSSKSVVPTIVPDMVAKYWVGAPVGP